MALRMDRLAEVSEAAAETVDAIPTRDLEASLPPAVRSVLGPLRLMRLDLVGLFRDTATTSLRRLPALAAEDPDRAEDIARWLVHAAAYLTDQTDDPPPGWITPLGSPPSNRATG